MAVIVHLNGKLVERADARIDPFDRGFIFGDGVYEGLRAIEWGGKGGSRVIGLGMHIERMRRGLTEVGIEWDPSRLGEMTAELVKANGIMDAFVYWQTTRGAPRVGEPVRSRVPAKEMMPTVFGYCVPQPPMSAFDARGSGAVPTKSAVTCEDQRWLMGYLKSVSLMGNVVASMGAEARGADDAIFVRSGRVAEGLATNVIVVDRDGRMATPSLGSVAILSGITRSILLREVSAIEERIVEVRELERASEVLLTGTTTMVTSVVKLDGRTVGEGVAGPVAKRLLGVLVEAIRAGRDV